MGVWIETRYEELETTNQSVTPFVGVWIETSQANAYKVFGAVTPFVGVWIETATALQKYKEIQVTPFVGVWIETTGGEPTPPSSGSHPSWVCGLKLNNLKLFDYESCHTLRGCVD